MDDYRLESTALKQFLINKGLYDKKACTLIDQIAQFFATHHDTWMCNICLYNGGEDTPNIWVCPFGCNRSYCDDCLDELGSVCKCGGRIRPTNDNTEKTPSIRISKVKRMIRLLTSVFR